MTFKREVFPGSGLPENPDAPSLSPNLTEQELLTRLRRAVKLYKDPGVVERDVAAKRALGYHILFYLKELRSRGYTISENGDSFIIHAPNTVELRKGDRVEIVDEPQMKRRVYWALSDAFHLAEKRGDKKRRAELFGAIAYLYRTWNIKAVSRQKRTIDFKEAHESDQQTEST